MSYSSSSSYSSSNKNNNNEANELRNHTKFLLNALKQQQNATKDCISVIKNANNSSANNNNNKKINSSSLNDDYHNDTQSQISLNETIKAKLLSLELETLSLLNKKAELLGNTTSVNDNLNQAKTVSFSDHLQTQSPRRRSRSVSPKTMSKRNKDNENEINKKKKTSQYSIPKSILKKMNKGNSKVVTDDDDDDDDDDIDGFRMFDRIEDFNLNNYEYYSNMKNLAKYNRDSFIECLSKTRQKYLNHDYNNSTINNNNNDSVIEIKQKKTPTVIKTGSNVIKIKSNLIKSKKLALSDNQLDKLKQDNEIIKSGKENVPSSNNNNNNKKSSNNNNKKKPTSTKSAPKNKPLLGYDWATDMLDNKKNNESIHETDDYWNELAHFRKQNRDDCVSNAYVENSFLFDVSQYMTLDDPDSLKHKCIHSYTLNERLFPVPTYVGDNGESICPVCKSGRKEPTNYAPQFCKISIPQSRLQPEYEIKPQKRSQYNREDTLSLSEHCVAGYQNSPVNSFQNIPKSKNIDLKSSTGCPSDFVKLTIDDVKKIATNKDPTAGIYNKGHAMRYELEDQHQKRLRELMPKINVK